MTRLFFKLGAAFALCALAGTAQAGGSFDGDDGYNGSGYGYQRKSLTKSCYQYPEDPRCENGNGSGNGSGYGNGYGYRYKQKKSYSYGYGGGACAATIRAAGKRNLFGAFARNSAIFSWQREVRAVHGSAYASWGRARRASVSCGPGGGALTACVAMASPCRY
jgi:hypothetical protein